MKGILSVLLVLYAGIAWGQADERIYEEVEFRFVTPGARAVGMGKAFVGLADDATAAYSNPAGLSNLLRQEFSLAVTSNDINHHRFVPSDTAETQVFGETVYSPSFISYVVPHKNFTFSLFRNVLQDYEENFQFAGRFIPSIGVTEGPTLGEMSLNAENYGAGVSYLLHSAVSIGGSFVIAHSDVNAKFMTGPADNPARQSVTNDSGSAAGVILGILTRPIPELSLGAVYHSGFQFELDTDLHGRFIARRGKLIDLTGTTRQIDYVIPGHFSLGTAYRWNDHLTTSLDLSRIFYSQQVTNKFLILTFFELLSHQNFFIDDVWEFHAGAEYRFHAAGSTIGLRAGLFTDPAHPLRFRAFPDTDPFVASIQAFRFNSLRPKTDVGITAGAGFVLANRVQLDAAVSFSRDSDEIVISWVVKL